MKLGRKVDSRVENAIIMKTRQLKVQKQSGSNVIKQLDHNKDTVRLHALKTVLKHTSKIEMAVPLVSMLLDPFDSIRKYCIEEIHLFTPIRIFAPLLMRTVASGLVHIIPSVRLDMLKLLKQLTSLVQYQKYVEFDLFLPILMKMYTEQAKLILKSLTLSCIVNIYNLNCTSSDAESLLRHLFVDTPKGKIPNFDLFTKPNSSRVLSAHWIETSSHLDMLNIIKTCLLYNCKMNKALILGKFPFTGPLSNDLNIWVATLYKSEETHSWLESNWTSMDDADYSVLLPIIIEKYDQSTLATGLNKLQWKNIDLEKRYQLLSHFMKLDLCQNSVELPRMLFNSVVLGDSRLIKIITESLSRHLSKYRDLRSLLYYRMRPIFILKTKSIESKGPIYNLDKDVACKIIDLLQFCTEKDAKLFLK
eukprot:NODE_574_length_6555_cov_0.194703.p2 type:complete len:419 gc:universal NODE_574_length_6555_cov_0.194703:3615-4871(+)